MQDAEASQGPLTYQVYTAQDIAVSPRMSRANFANAAPPVVPLHKRVGVMAAAAGIVLCTAFAAILGIVDDGPKAPREATAAMPPPAAIDSTPAPIDPTSVTTTTSFIPPVVTIVDDPSAQPAAAPKPRKKKAINSDAANAASGSNGAIVNVSAPPPNPYAVSKK